MLSLRTERRNQDRHEALNAGAVALVEAGGERRVAIEHAEAGAGPDARHDGFGARFRIAGDLARKFVPIRHDHRSAARRRRAAHAPAPRNAYAGRLALERAEDEFARAVRVHPPTPSLPRDP